MDEADVRVIEVHNAPEGQDGEEVHDQLGELGERGAEELGADVVAANAVKSPVGVKAETEREDVVQRRVVHDERCRDEADEAHGDDALKRPHLAVVVSGSCGRRGTSRNLSIHNESSWRQTAHWRSVIQPFYASFNESGSQPTNKGIRQAPNVETICRVYTRLPDDISHVRK